MSLISGLFILLLVLFIIYRVGLYLKLETIHENKVAFVYLALFNATLLGISWPGFVSVDDLYLLKELNLSGSSAWHSFTYSFLTAGMNFITSRPFHLSLLNYSLFLLALTSLFSTSQWRYKDPAYWLLLFVLSMPQTAQLIFYQNRDSTYGLFFINFILGLFSAHFSRFPSLRSSAWGLLFIGVLLGELRQEGKVITLVAPFLIAYFYRLPKKQLVLSVLTTLIFSFLLQWGPERIYPAFEPYSAPYKVTAVLNPLTYIVNKIGVNSLSPEARQDIDAIIQLDSMTRFANPYDIDAFHNGGLRLPIEPNTFTKFRTASLQLIFENFSLYLENRWLIFKRMFLFEPQYNLFPDALRNLPDLSFLELLEKLQTSGKSPSYTTAEQAMEKWMNIFTAELPLPLHLVISSSLISLLTLVFLCINFKKYPIFAALAALILVRSFIVLTLAPAAYFKYVSSTWVLGWVLILLFRNKTDKALAQAGSIEGRH